MISEFVVSALFKGSNINVEQHIPCLKYDFGKTLLPA